MRERRSTLVVMAISVVLVLWCTAHAQQPVFATGKQYMKAATPKGQFISFIYINEETVRKANHRFLSCGINVSELVYEYRVENGDAFMYVHKLKPVNQKVGWYYEDKAGKGIEGTTTFTDLDYSTGKITLTIAALPFSKPNSKFGVVLDSPVHGRLSALLNEPKTANKPAK